jgi:hypothetical protein
MSNETSLEDILGELEQKPTFGAALEKMDNDHFRTVCEAVQNEYAKRVPVDYSNLTNGEFGLLRRNLGV